MKSPDVIFALPLTSWQAGALAKFLRRQAKFLDIAAFLSDRRSPDVILGLPLTFSQAGALANFLRKHGKFLDIAAFLSTRRFKEWDGARKRLEKVK